MKRLVSHFLQLSSMKLVPTLRFYTCCMGDSIESWLWIHTILIVQRNSLHCRRLRRSLVRHVSPWCGRLLTCLCAITASLLNLIFTHAFSQSHSHTYTHTHTHKHSDLFPPYQTQVVQSCMMGVVWCSCLLVQCSRELELFRGTRQRSDGRPLCSTPQQHNTRRNSFLMSLLRSV